MLSRMHHHALHVTWVASRVGNVVDVAPLISRPALRTGRNLMSFLACEEGRDGYHLRDLRVKPAGGILFNGRASCTLALNGKPKLLIVMSRTIIHVCVWVRCEDC